MLEEFFKCPPPEEENRLEVEFEDLEYELKRQTSDSGNSYVGQRLAKGRPDQNDFCVRIDSPRKHMSNSNLLGLQVGTFICLINHRTFLYIVFKFSFHNVFEKPLNPWEIKNDSKYFHC